MISDTARHKLLVLSGQCSENTGELILQSGSFSFFNFIDIFTDQEVSQRGHIIVFQMIIHTFCCPEKSKNLLAVFMFYINGGIPWSISTG